MEKAVPSLAENLVFQNFCAYLPNIVRFIGTASFGWGRAEQIFNAELKRREAERKEKEFIMVEATLFDMIMEAKDDNKQALALLEFLDTRFQQLSLQLNRAEKAMLQNTVSSMLHSMDIRYLNFAGEIAVLHALLKSGAFGLAAVEWPLPNGKTIDFRLYKKEGGVYYLVEVMNIHIDGEKIERDPAAIERFLRNRAAQKFSKKRENLTEEIPFYLIPVLWGSAEEISIYKKFYVTYKPTFPATLEPFVYYVQTDGLDIFQPVFRKVSTFPTIS